MNQSGKMSTISTERTESIDREDDQETPPGTDRLTNLNTTLANNNNNYGNEIRTSDISTCFLRR